MVNCKYLITLVVDWKDLSSKLNKEIEDINNFF